MNEVSKMSIEELKAIAYDLICQLNWAQSNLNEIEREIALREQTPKVPVREPEQKPSNVLTLKQAK